MTEPARDLRALVQHSRWASRWPGLRPAAEKWLDDLPQLLREADVRSEEILSSGSGGRSLVRLAQLAASAAPALGQALRSGDTDDMMKGLADAALHGGPTYVKLGQLIASTRGLVPEAIADMFAGCRDAVPPAPASAVASVLRGSGIDDQLRSWDRRPIASASVAQVHHAILLDGKEVVVKVRRPRIVGTVAADVSYLAPLLRLAERRSARARLANLSGTLELMVRLFAQEVDLRLEAANVAEMAMALERAGLDVRVPAPVPGLVTKRALVMEYVEGTSWVDAEGVSQFKHSGLELVRVLMAGVLETTLIDGIFHGDLHPGNVFVDAHGLSLLDYGIIGRLSATQREALGRLFLALVARDQLAIVSALKDFGAVPADVDPAELIALLPAPPTDEEIRAMTRDRSQIPDRFAHIQRVLSEKGFRVVPEMALFARNLLYLSEAIDQHAPGLDLVTEVASLATGFRKRHREY
jgi:ubiquinone biosynthesis protein